MDFITITRQGDKKPMTIAVDSIVSFWDEKENTTRISLENQEYVMTNGAISSSLRKQLALMSHRIIKVGD